MKAKAFFASALAAAACAAAPFEHCIFDSVKLDGAWEMAYRPYAWESLEQPVFEGCVVENAVPGYWEDMADAFRAAGIGDAFRINPLYEVQRFPISGYASDTTLPNIYGCFFYRRTVTLDRGGDAVLAFEGVRNQVHVWINGRFAGFRAGFSTPFELAVPVGALRRGENEIVMAVSNNPNPGYNGGQVSGLATRANFRATGGVNGRLELRFPKSGISDVYVTTSPDLKTFTIHVGGAGKGGFSYEILDGSSVVASGRATGDFTVGTEGYEFWSPENPKRYGLRVSAAGGTYEQKFGIRRLLADGEKLKLNGRPVYLRGITEHCYFPKTLSIPRDLEYYRMITAKRKELGFKFVRFHTFVPPVEYLEATDELGMLVHIESPNFVPESEFESIISFARRHPSVVIYCTGNETRIDRLAEAYLSDIAGMVHERTDSLFSPMSAMRGVEYFLVKGKDAISGRPFAHNPERMARLSEYCDLYTSYQLGAVSYDSLNKGTAADLDAWGDAYCGKPRTSHEICIDGSYIDLGLEKLYPENSPILKTGIFSEPRRLLEEKGLLDRAGTYFRNSCEWMWRIRKHCFEKLRAADRVAGFDFLGDINTHWHTFGYFVGMMDEFYRLKPGESVENALRYNSAAVVLCDLGSDFNVVAGDVKKVAFSVSNYDAPAPDGRLEISLADERGNAVFADTLSAGDVPCGKVSGVGIANIPSAAAKKYLLKVSFSGGKVKASNEWEMYAFPKTEASPVPAGVKVLASASEAELSAAMENGERVLLLGAGPFKSLKTSFRIGLAGRCSGNYATVVKRSHPAFAEMPNDGFCGWQFRRLMEGGDAVQLEADVPFDPVVDIASSVKCVIRQAMAFEYRVGKGRLMVCSFRFGDGDPAAAWLKDRLVAYVSGDRFDPPHEITVDGLKALIAAPLVTGAENSNRARNPNDPSSAVRAGRFARP